MNILVTYSSLLTGQDPAIRVLVSELEHFASAKVTLLDVHENPSLPEDAPEEGYAAILLVETTSWYADNCLILKGRPWVGLVALSLDGVLPFLRDQLSLVDSAIRAIFSTSSAFVTQVSAAVPALFTWKPIVVPTAPAEVETIFGSVLINVLDRDFSQLLVTLKVLKEQWNPEALKIFVCDKEKMRIPDQLVENVRFVCADALWSAFKGIKYYVPAPRITDIRSGIIPSDLMQAAASGAQLLLIDHPLLRPISAEVNPMFKSVKSYSNAVADIAAGSEVVTTSLSDEVKPPPRRLASQIWAALKRYRDENA